MFKELLIALSLLCVVEAASGQSRFLNRPSKTESSTVLDKGVLQLESAYEIEVTGSQEEQEKEILFPGISLRYGLGWGIELRLANHYETVKDKMGTAGGFADLELGTEIYLFKRNDNRTQVAFLTSLFLPVGSMEISNERFGNESFVVVWHEISDKTGVEYNLGYSNFEDDSEKGDFIYAIAAEYEINERSGIFLELYGELIELYELEASFDLGFSYMINDGFELDLALGRGINHKMNFATIGVSWRPGFLYQ